MGKKVKDLMSLRLLMLLCLLTIGKVSIWADDMSSSSGSSNATEDVKTYDFSSTAGQAIISGLAGSATQWNVSNIDLSTSINGFPVTFHRCLRGSNKLIIRGDNEYGGYVSGTWKGTLTQVTLVTVGYQSGNASIIVEKDGKGHTATKEITGRGTFTIDINDPVEDANSITVSTDFQCQLSQIILKRNVTAADAKDPWIIFKKWNGEAYPIEDTETHYAKAGQILKLESNGVEGFDPVSNSTNPYVVTYTVDGSEPEFSFVMSNGNWKNGNDKDLNGNAINKNGYIYRRGIVLDKRNENNKENSKKDEEITVKLGIFKLTADENGNFTNYTQVKTITKQFTLEASTRPDIEGIGENKEITYSPNTKQKTDTEVYQTSMKILDPTQHIIVSEAGASQNATIIAKFSKSDKYDLQSLMNAANVTPTVSKKSMKTSTTGLRKLSSITFTQDGVASRGVAVAYYWFIPTRTQLNLEVTAERATIDLTQGKNEETSKITVKGYYIDGEGNKQYVNLKDELGFNKTNITVGDKQVFNHIASTVGETTSDIVFEGTNNTTAWFTIKGYDNGVSSLRIQTSETQNGTEENGEFKPAALNYTAATFTTNLTVTGSNKMAAPSITPSTRYYAKDFTATVTGVENLKTYYLLYSHGTTTGEISLRSGNPISTLSDEASSDEEGSNEETVYELTAKDVVDAVLEYQKNPSLPPDYAAAGILDGDKQAQLNIAAKKGNVFTLYAVVADVDDEGNITTKEVTSSDGTTTETVEQSSRVVQSTYTYSKLESPVLSPGIEGHDHFYPYDGKQLSISASVESSNCQIYYLVSSTESLNLTQNEDGTITTNAKLYDAEKNITISGTTMIQAIAYSSTLGQVSDVVTYRYANMSTDIDAPSYHVDGKVYQGGEIIKTSIQGKSLLLQSTVHDSNDNTIQVGGENVNWDTDIYHIYYTTDGTYPTSSSHRYEGPITDIDNSHSSVTIIAIAYANGTDANGNKGDGSISDYSILTLLNGNANYWETNTDNCGTNGVLNNNNQSITQNGETLVNIEFGGSKDASGKDLTWRHYVSAEYATGNPIDHVGEYTIAPSTDANEDVADVKDEAGNIWNHSKANDGSADYQTHKGTFGLPASGAYVKFEPKKSGKLTIWCCQEGALYYNNKSSAANYFNEGFLRKRPAYFIDEAGKSIKPEEAKAAGVLSANWVMRTTAGSWNKKGDIVNGIEQKLYTQEQTALIYEMFNQKILANGATWNTSLQPLIVYLNTEENKTVAGFNVAENAREEGDQEATHPYATDDNVDGTGVCLPSASYMKYTFDVKAGKTYFFFGWMTKIGIRGFGFEPSAVNPIDDEVSINSGNSGTSDGGDSKDQNFNAQLDKTYAKATLNREFKAGIWTTLVLPFSVSASQIKEKFGENTEILHYRTIENRTMYFFKHFHQMIVAGTPILIKPEKAITSANFVTFDNVTFESASVTDTPCNDYGYVDANGNATTENTTWKMVGSYAIQHVADYNYYINNAGWVKRLINDGKGNDLNGTRAYIVGTTGSDNEPAITSMAKAAFDNLIPENMSGDTTDIDFIETSDGSNGITDGNVYSLDGQLVRKQGESLKGLSKGVYILNGKKVVVQ